MSPFALVADFSGPLTHALYVGVPSGPEQLRRPHMASHAPEKAVDRYTHRTFAPNWFKCAACSLGLIPTPVLSIASLWNPWLLLGILPSLILFQFSLATAMTGKPPPSLFRIMMSMRQGKAKVESSSIKH
jgi:hypothetical protein